MPINFCLFPYRRCVPYPGCFLCALDISFRGILQCVSTPLGNLSMSLFNPGCPCLGNITLDMLMSPDIGRNNQCFFLDYRSRDTSLASVSFHKVSKELRGIPLF